MRDLIGRIRRLERDAPAAALCFVFVEPGETPACALSRQYPHGAAGRSVMFISWETQRSAVEVTQ